MRHKVSLSRWMLVVAVIGSALSPGRLRGQDGQASVDVLTKRSEVVAVGKVTGLKSEWDQNKSRIVTRVTVAVGEYLKGSAGSVLTITSPGGEVDGVGEWYSHTARFTKDEEFVVFAEKDKKGDYRVAGGSQGKVPVLRDAASGTARVSDRTSLDDFKARVKDAVRAQVTK